MAHGVTQDSALGPILFLILVNDLIYNALLLADDTTIVSHGSEAEKVFVEAKIWHRVN